MAQPVTHPAKEGVATFRSCADPARAHSFPLGVGKEFSMEQTLELLTKVGRKLDFQCADLLAWTIDLPVYVDNGNTRRGTFKVSQQSCVCGFGAQAECLQTLSAHLAQMQRERVRRGEAIVLHISQKEAETYDESLETNESTLRSSPKKSGYAACSHQNPLDARAHKLQKHSPAELRMKAQNLWATLEKAKVYISPLDVEKPMDKFHLERHGHGRGNTKSTKKRRKRQDRHDLCRAS